MERKQPQFVFSKMVLFFRNCVKNSSRFYRCNEYACICSSVELHEKEAYILYKPATPIYLTIIPRVRVGNDHLNKREWNNCFIKNAHKISKIFPDFIFKSNRFLAYF